MEAPEKSKQLAADLRKKLQNAYDRGASAEATRLLVQEFSQLRRKYEERLNELKREAGL
jgi:hypothetical protein